MYESELFEATVIVILTHEQWNRQPFIKTRMAIDCDEEKKKEKKAAAKMTTRQIVNLSTTMKENIIRFTMSD